jgi:hypothetical protein
MTAAHHVAIAPATCLVTPFSENQRRGPRESRCRELLRRLLGIALPIYSARSIGLGLPKRKASAPPIDDRRGARAPYFAGKGLGATGGPAKPQSRQSRFPDNQR